MCSLKKNLILTLLLSSSFVMPSFSQLSENISQIKGEVRDSNNEEVIGAYVSVEEMSYQAVTDENGLFVLSDIPYGTYHVTISYLGKKNRRRVVVDAPTKKIRFEIDTDDLLNEIVVETKTDSRKQEEKPIPIESIELSTIENQVKDVGEAVDRLSGVRVRASGSFGDRADIAVNGLNGTAVRSYINGLPLEFVYPNLDLANLPINSIERIDVYKGVLPVDIGTDAMGGGINLITKEKDYNEIKAFYGYGSFNTHQSGLNLNLKLKEGINASLNTAYNYSDNNFKTRAYVWEAGEEQIVRRFNDAYELFFVEGKIAISDKKWTDKFTISLNYVNSYKEIQHGNFMDRTAFGDVNYKGDNFTILSEYQKSITEKVNFRTAFSYSHSNVVFTDTTANVYSWSGEVVNRFSSRAGEYGVALLTDRNFENFTNRTSINYQISNNDEILISNVLAQQGTTGRNELIQNGENDYLTRNQTLLKNVLGLQYNRSLFKEKLTLSAALKHYFYDLAGVDSRSMTPVTLKSQELGWYGTAKYQVNKNLFFRASYENALRIPFFNQFFGNGGTIVSNINLQPETSNNYNLGLVYRKTVSSKLTYVIDVNSFIRNQKELIYLAPTDVQRYENAEEVNTRGAEMDIAVGFFEHWQVKGNLTYFRKVYASIDERNQGIQFLIGTDFPNTPDLFSNLQLEYNKRNSFKDDDRFYAYARYVFIDEFNFLNQSQVYNPENYVPVQNRVDVGISYSLWNEKITLALNANNVLNSEVFDNFSIPKPMRNYNFRLTYQLSDF